jgi:hypothetical protein
MIRQNQFYLVVDIQFYHTIYHSNLKGLTIMFIANESFI